MEVIVARGKGSVIKKLVNGLRGLKGVLHGDVTLSNEWRLLGAFEAANGIIMFGWTTALITSVAQRLFFHDEQESEDDRPTIAITHWTDRTELFMEYPVFVAGESGRSAIHVTDLADFSPLSTGEAIVTLRAEDGNVLEFRDGPSRPGIFGVDPVAA